jgi:hypothetical protein
MKTWKKALVPAAIALTVLAPLSAFAADADSAAANAAGGGTPLVKQLHGFKERSGGQRQDIRKRLAESVGPHHELYMELLAEKYAPDTLDAWKTAFAERKAALDQLKALLPKLQDKAADKITKEQLRQRLEQKKEATAPEIEARRALREESRKAAADQDAGELAAVLPKLLYQYKQDTARLEQKISGLQAGSAGTADQSQAQTQEQS